MIFDFYAKDRESWEKQKTLLTTALETAFSAAKNFSIKIGAVEKTSKQLRGFYRLCGIIAPYMQQHEGVLMDRDLVKEYVKQECNYCVPVKGRIITKSLTEATREEMHFFIEKMYEICEAYDIENYELTSYETQALLEFYETKK